MQGSLTRKPVAIPRRPSSQLTEAELEVLRVFWDRVPRTVREIHNTLAAHRHTGYSTTLKMAQVMLEKKLLQHDTAVHPQIYRPTATREQTDLAMLDHLAERVFDRSAKRLMLSLLPADRFSPHELREMQRLIRKAKEQESTSPRESLGSPKDAAVLKATI